MESKNSTQNIIDISIKLGLLVIILAWCAVLLMPFVSIVLWSVIIAIAASPVQSFLVRKLGGREKLSVFIIVLFALLLIAIPTWLFLDSIFEGVKDLKGNFNPDSITFPPPNERVANLPIIGKKLYDVWLEASISLGAFATKYSDELMKFGNVILDKIVGVGGSILQMIIATIIAGALLLSKAAPEIGRAFFRKVAGDRGDEFANVAVTTISKVVQGVFGVALIQSFLIGIGFLLAGVPYAGLWTLLVLILVILQMPPLVVVLPILFYLFSEMNVVPAVLWTIYLILAGASDNVLKPMLLGKGAPVPMLVIFLGVLGGFISSGFIGLFIGAIILSIGYKLFISWIKPEVQKQNS